MFFTSAVTRSPPSPRSTGFQVRKSATLTVILQNGKRITAGKLLCPASGHPSNLGGNLFQADSPFHNTRPWQLAGHPYGVAKLRHEHTTSHAVWLYFRFCLSFRDVEELLLERGVVVTSEAIRRWCRKFGQDYATQLRRRRPRPGDKWPMNEV